ncbi:MAG: hypothetical protein ACLFUJ_07955 [Phycisphaerae bacterium]
MKYTICLSLVLSAALAGCQQQTSFTQQLQLRDSVDGRTIETAWIVRALHQSHEQKVGVGSTTLKRWTATVDIVPAGSGIEYEHPADAPTFSTDAFTRTTRGEKYFEIFLLADGYAPMRITSKELANGQFQMRRIETIPNGREILRAAEFIEQVVLPNTEQASPGRDEVLAILISQLEALEDRGVANLGLAGRIATLQAAISPAHAAPTAQAD